MSELNNRLVCFCGKKRNALNATNWNRHVTSCKVVRLTKTSKMCKSLTEYFLQKKNQSVVKMIINEHVGYTIK